MLFAVACPDDIADCSDATVAFSRSISAAETEITFLLT
jgi:hypothetical protein